MSEEEYDDEEEWDIEKFNDSGQEYEKDDYNDEEKKEEVEEEPKVDAQPLQPQSKKKKEDDVVWLMLDALKHDDIHYLVNQYEFFITSQSRFHPDPSFPPYLQNGPPLISVAAFYHAEKCFFFLFNNGHQLVNDHENVSVFAFACYGGSRPIIHQLLLRYFKFEIEKPEEILYALYGNHPTVFFELYSSFPPFFRYVRSHLAKVISICVHHCVSALFAILDSNSLPPDSVWAQSIPTQAEENASLIAAQKLKEKKKESEDNLKPNAQKPPKSKLSKGFKKLYTPKKQQKLPKHLENILNRFPPKPKIILTKDQLLKKKQEQKEKREQLKIEQEMKKKMDPKFPQVIEDAFEIDPQLCAQIIEDGQVPPIEIAKGYELLLSRHGWDHFLFRLPSFYEFFFQMPFENIGFSWNQPFLFDYLIAIARNRPDSLLTAIQSCPEIQNFKLRDGRNFLHYIVTLQIREPLIRGILKTRIFNPNDQDKNLNTPLHLAITKKNIPMVRELIELPNLDLTLVNDQLYNPFQLALATNFTSVPEFFKDPRQPLGLKVNGRPIWFEIIEKPKTYLSYLRKNPAFQKVKNQIDDDGNHFLHYLAIKKGRNSIEYLQTTNPRSFFFSYCSNSEMRNDEIFAELYENCSPPYNKDGKNPYQLGLDLKFIYSWCQK